MRAKAVGWTAVYMIVVLGIMLVMSVILAGVCFLVGIKTGTVSMNNMYGYENFVGQLVAYVQQGTPLMLMNFAQEFVMFVCFGLWYYLREKKYHYLPNYKKAFSGRNVLSMAGIAFFGQYASNLIVILIYVVLPDAFEKYQETMQLLEIDAGNPFVMVFIVGLFGPLVEEILFRGMIFGKLRRAYSFWPSALISGILFGVFHMNLVQGLYAAVFGVVLAYIFEKTETIWGCYMLHAFFNISSYIISGYESALSGIGIEVPAVAELALGVISLGIVIVLLRRFGKNSRLT
jgi:hypothetical protein